MTTRQTSIQAWRELQISGRVRGRRLDVVLALAHLDPATAGEVAEWLRVEVESGRAARSLSCESAPSRNDVSTRLRELRDLGYVREGETRRCEVSGRRVISYALTGATRPVEAPPRREAPPKASSRRASISSIEDYLRREAAENFEDAPEIRELQRILVWVRRSGGVPSSFDSETEDLFGG